MNAIQSVLCEVKMKKILILVFLVIGGSVLAAAVDQASKKTYSWRYKMTVEVQTPEGIKTGSVVREVNLVFETILFLTQKVYKNKLSVSGEAVVVDLGERGVLFALLKGAFGSHDHAKRFLFEVFESSYGGTTLEGAKYYSQLKNVKTEVELKHYPMLVTFSDVGNPKTVKNVLEVDMGDGSYLTEYKIKTDRFEEIFGEGVYLKKITVEMTDEPVTWGIEKLLPWLPDRKNVTGYLGGESEPPFDDPSKTYLNGVAFSQGKFW